MTDLPDPREIARQFSERAEVMPAGEDRLRDDGLLYLRERYLDLIDEVGGPGEPILLPGEMAAGFAAGLQGDAFTASDLERFLLDSAAQAFPAPGISLFVAGAIRALGERAGPGRAINLNLWDIRQNIYLPWDSIKECNLIITGYVWADVANPDGRMWLNFNCAPASSKRQWYGLCVYTVNNGKISFRLLQGDDA